MGLPIDTYQVLEFLLSGPVCPEDAEYVDELRSALARYSAVAFIIYDPAESAELAKTLHEEFEYLDDVTGQHLLFLALCTAPSEWTHRVLERPEIAALSKLRSQPPRRVDLAHGLPTDGERARMLGSALGFAGDDLPCIVVTTDPTENDFVAFRTCPEHLVEQLSRLGHFAARVHRGQDVETLRHRIVAELDLCGGYSWRTLAASLADVLAEVLATFQDPSQLPAALGSVARQRCYGAVSRARRELAELRRAGRANDETFDYVALRLALAIQGLRPAESQTVRGGIRTLGVETPQGLETESRRLLDTAACLADYMTRNHRAQDFDWTPLGICFVKVLELELALSAFQWARECAGIPMPEYFRKVAPPLPRLELGNGLRVNLNERRNGAWKPPTLGHSISAFRHFVDMGEPITTSLLAHATTDRVSRWQEQQALRNRMAHESGIRVGDANRALEIHRNMCRAGDWAGLMELKARLMSTPRQETGA